MTRTRRLRQLIEADNLTIAPGGYDGLTARLIESAGFPAVYMTGAGTSATYGYPDYGLLTMSEMVANGARMAAATELPVIADADTGYGNELNVFRTVREYERAGVAGIHMEDQTFPKRCGHLDQKQVIPLDDYVAKVRAAVDARTDPDFVIIARTDARAVEGFDAAVVRVNAALEAGADVAFLEAPQTMEEVRNVPKLVQGPCLLNVVRGGKTPNVDLRDAESFGYRLAIVPGVLLAAAIGICDQMLAELKATHRHPKPPGDLSPKELFARVGSAFWDERRERYKLLAPDAKAAE